MKNSAGWKPALRVPVLLRAIFIILWTLIGFIVWPSLLYLAILGDIYSQRHFGLSPVGRWLPDWADYVLFYGLFGAGTITAAVVMLILGLRGKLPGTRLV